MKASAKLVNALLMFLVRCYRFCLSPLLPKSCRFEPSCSRYTLDALAQHGPWQGGLLAIKRIARCHPWNPGGFDPVPPPTSKKP